MKESVVSAADLDLFELSALLDRVAERVRTAASSHIGILHDGTTSDAGLVRLHLVRAAESLYRERRRRERSFADYRDLLGDHVLDMLLTLFIGHERKATVSLSSACYATGAPQSTALRYVARLEERGLVVRCGDPSDGRRQLLDLTAVGLKLMESYLADYPFGTGQGRP